MSRKFKMLVVALSVVVILAVGLTSVAFAAGPNENTTCPENCTVPRNGGDNGFGRGGVTTSDAVASLLGMTEEQIREQRQAGKSLMQIASEKGISEDALIKAILTEREAALQERVKTGTLTQEQANLMLENMNKNIQEAINRTATGPSENRGAIVGPADSAGQNAFWGGQCQNGETGSVTGSGTMQRFGRGNR
jgi:hypothetical protein